VRLITAHRILIAAGIVLFVLYAAIQLRGYLAAGAPAALAQSVLSAAVAVGFALYYRSLSRWGRRS
jgi:hypothetical protein